MSITFLGRSTTVATSDVSGCSCSHCSCNLLTTLYVLGGRNCSSHDCFFTGADVDASTVLTFSCVGNTCCEGTISCAA